MSKYLTANFTALSEVRKLEVLMEIVNMIAFNNDVDADTYVKAVTALDDVRVIVAENTKETL
jgi:hypothetical protein